MENKLREIIRNYQYYGVSLENRASIYFCDDGMIAVSYAGDEGYAETLEGAIEALVNKLESNDYYQKLVQLDKKDDREFHKGMTCEMAVKGLSGIKW